MAKSQSISYQTKAAGTAPALSVVVPWPPIKTYPGQEKLEQEALEPAEIKHDDLATQEIAALSHENDVLRKVVLRLRGEIQFQIKFWERGLKHGEWESIQTMRRRLSRLKGSLDYLREYYPEELLKDVDTQRGPRQVKKK